MILLSIVLAGSSLCVADCRQCVGSLFVIRGDDGSVGKYANDCGKSDNPKKLDPCHQIKTDYAINNYIKLYTYTRTSLNFNIFQSSSARPISYSLDTDAVSPRDKVAGT